MRPATKGREKKRERKRKTRDKIEEIERKRRRTMAYPDCLSSPFSFSLILSREAFAIQFTRYGSKLKRTNRYSPPDGNFVQLYAL